MEVIDSHTHVISAVADRYPTTPLGAHQPHWSKARPVNHDGLTAVADQAGMVQAAGVQAATVYGHDARYAIAYGLLERGCRGGGAFRSSSPSTPAAVNFRFRGP